MGRRGAPGGLEGMRKGRTAMICNLCPGRYAPCAPTPPRGGGAAPCPPLPVVAGPPSINGGRPSRRPRGGHGLFLGIVRWCRVCQNKSATAELRPSHLPVERLRAHLSGAHARPGSPQHRPGEEPLCPRGAQHWRSPCRAVVWNSGGYDTLRPLRALEGKVDILSPTSCPSPRARRRATPPDAPRLSGGGPARPVWRCTARPAPASYERDGLLRRGV